MKPPLVPGDRFGRWTVVDKAPNATEPSGKQWPCVLVRCVCGNSKRLKVCVLRKGTSRSCGCLKDEVTIIRSTTHGMSGTVILNIWKNLMQRCFNPRNPQWKDYGGRGITVCERWRLFKNFLEDMGVPPKGMSLDRIDNNGPYCKENCRWATRTEQNRNSRRNRKLTHGGVTLCISEWAEKTGIDHSVLRNRISRGWSEEDTVTVKVGQPRQ